MFLNQEANKQTNVESAEDNSSQEVNSVESQSTNEAPVSAPKEPEWTPSYKYKVYNEEKEIPEKYRGFVNKDNEKELLDIFRKADTFEPVTKDFNRVKEEATYYQKNFQEVNQKAQKYEEVIKPLEWAIKNNNLDYLFKYLGVEQKQLEEHLHKKLSLPPEMQGVYNQSNELSAQAFQNQLEREKLQAENDRYRQAIEFQEATRLGNELEQTLVKPEISAASQAWLKRTGQDTFRDEVIARGKYLSLQKGYDVPVSEAVNDFIRYTGLNVSQMDIGQPIPSKPPTIPNLGSSTSAPIRRKISSMEDLRKLSKELEQE